MTELVAQQYCLQLCEWDMTGRCSRIWHERNRTWQRLKHADKKKSSKIRVTSTVFTILENRMDASLTERLSTGTLSLLGGVPQRNTSVFRSLNLQFVFYHPFCNLKTRLKFPITFNADSRSFGRHEYSSESAAKSCNRCRTFELRLPTVWCREKRGGDRTLIPAGRHRQERSPLTKNAPLEFIGTYKASKGRTSSGQYDPSFPTRCGLIQA